MLLIEIIFGALIALLIGSPFVRLFDKWKKGEYDD